jgi:hypothetical protein
MLATAYENNVLYNFLLAYTVVIFLNFGALTIHPPTNQPCNISTHTIRAPNKPSAVTIYFCDILTPIRSVKVFFVHPSFEVDGLPHVTWCPPSSKCFVTSCPPFPEAKFGWFVTWSLDPFVMSCRLFSKMWMFCHKIFSNTFGMSSRLFSKMWTFSCIILGAICNVLPPAQKNVDFLSQYFFDTFVCMSVCVCVSPTNPWISVLCALT